ncbi:hypothetical protein K502DRAFT_322690 [Neoconidiobolus thromboides FSU 785]|nr:hypothetical protein K502DRAFT_322690 [Neoconidiobolus thromboides FSU 785]
MLQLNRFCLFILLLSTNLILCDSTVPDPLPEICYSGGVLTNPCKGTSCAPCWVQQPDGKWACYDYLADGSCQWGEDVGNRVKNRNSPNSSNNSNNNGNSNDNGSVTVITEAGHDGATTVTARKVSSTKLVIVTKTISAGFGHSVDALYFYLLVAILICF